MFTKNGQVSTFILPLHFYILLVVNMVRFGHFSKTRPYTQLDFVSSGPYLWSSLTLYIKSDQNLLIIYIEPNKLTNKKRPWIKSMVFVNSKL